MKKQAKTSSLITLCIFALLAITILWCAQDQPSSAEHLSQVTQQTHPATTQSFEAQATATSASKNPLAEHHRSTPLSYLINQSEELAYSSSIQGNTQIKRTLYKSHFKYPFVRIDHTVTVNRRGAETRNQQIAMVADHVLVSVPTEKQNEFLRLIRNSGDLTIRKRLETQEHFLVAMKTSPSLATVEQLQKRLRDLGITKTDPDYLKHNSLTPNDPSYSKLWGLHNTGQTGGSADADIDSPEAWDIGTGSEDTIVAVIDSGVDYTHEDLNANMWTDANGKYGYDYADGDDDPKDITSDRNPGHGTHVAGTIGAVGNNAKGISGVCWNVKIMAVRALGADGTGANSDIISSIRYATDNGAKVINLSLGGDGGSNGDSLYTELERSRTQGVIVCAAAGNGGDDKIGDNNDLSPHYPSSYNLDNIISIAATDASDQLTRFSNYGSTSVDLAAPGNAIYSTLPSNRYGNLNGTSMATPHVSGAAALIFSLDPTLTYTKVRSLLLNEADELTQLDNKVSSNGRLNTLNSIVDLAGPSLRLEDLQIAMLDGNNDPHLNPGETFTINFRAKNAGSDPADNLTATLKLTSNPNLAEILTSQISLGTISAGAETTITNDFRLRANSSPNLPQTLQATIEVSSSTATTIWTKSLDITINLPGAISGTIVRQQTGSPISQATIHYSGPTNGTVQSDSQGRFKIEGIAGTYNLNATATGLTASQPQTIQAPTQNITFSLGTTTLRVTPNPVNITLAQQVKHTHPLTLSNSGDSPRNISYTSSLTGGGSGEKIYALSKTGDIVLLDSTTGAIQSTIYESPSNRYGFRLAVTQDHAWLAVEEALANGQPNILLDQINIKTGAITQSIDLSQLGSFPYVNGLFVDEENVILSAVNQFGISKLWQIDDQKGTLIDINQTITSSAESMTNAPDRNSLFVLTYSSIEERDLDTFALKNTIELPFGLYVAGLTYSQSSTALIVIKDSFTSSSSAQTIEKWNPDDGTKTSTYPNPPALRAITIQKNSTPPWITLTNESGKISFQDQTQLPLEFDTTGLKKGTYTTSLTLRSDLLTSPVEVPITLTVTDTNLDQWLSTHKLSRSDLSSDPDKDGHTNLFEFVFGGDPQKNEALSGLPKFRPTSEGMQLTMTMRKGIPESMLTIQKSNNLDTWGPAKINTDYTVSSRSSKVGNPDYETMTLSWQGVGDGVFLRIRLQVE